MDSKAAKPRGFSVAELAVEYGCGVRNMYKILQNVSADMSGSRYSLPAVLSPLIMHLSGFKETDLSETDEPIVRPLDRLNSIKADRETLKLHTEMGKLGRAEDWDSTSAEAMKSLGNSLDSLPDELVERLNLDDTAFKLCQRVVDGFRQKLYADLVLGEINEDEDDDDE